MDLLLESLLLMMLKKLSTPYRGVWIYALKYCSQQRNFTVAFPLQCWLIASHATSYEVLSNQVFKGAELQSTEGRVISMTVFTINVLLGSIYIIMGMEMIITCHLLFYYVPLKSTLDESIHPFFFIDYSNRAHLYNPLGNLHNKNSLDSERNLSFMQLLSTF